MKPLVRGVLEGLKEAAAGKHLRLASSLFRVHTLLQDPDFPLFLKATSWKRPVRSPTQPTYLRRLRDAAQPIAVRPRIAAL